MKVELLSVGTELLLGDIVDTNAVYLAEKLSELGISVFHKTTVGDNAERIAAALRVSLDRSDVVLATGGLGPTEDDVTAAAVAQLMGVGLVEDEATADKIRSFARQRGIDILDRLLKQASVPCGAVVVPNPIGTAPGFILNRDDGTVIALPGVPSEMKAMAQASVLPYLSREASLDGPATIFSRLLRLAGIGESQAEAAIADLIQTQTNPTIAPLARSFEVHLRLTARAVDAAAAEGLIAPIEAEIRRRLGEHIYGTDDEALEELVGRQLRDAGLTTAVAESCTGGLIGHRLTNVPGSSDYLKAVLVTYSNESKVDLLGVPREVLERHGAVSEEVARAMAEGAVAACRTDTGLAVTGIAGPGGATQAKPVGLVYLATTCGGQTVAERHLLRGNRLMIKERAAQAALWLLHRTLVDRATREGEPCLS